MILLITSAHIEENYEVRKEDYIKSIKSVLKFKNSFKRIIILECVSKDIEYLKLDKDIEIYYSKVKNFYKNKGLNEVYHTNTFLQSMDFNDNEKFIKITGRYFIQNDTFINFCENNSYDFIGKRSNDIYENDSSRRAFHTFYMSFTRKLLNDFYNSFLPNPNPLFGERKGIESYIYNYVVDNCNNYFIFKGKMGIMTNILMFWRKPPVIKKVLS
tara:strand:- start:3213 stop:3854 length:642 start_codon:yes stop_codon:yes gene_type:complete